MNSEGGTAIQLYSEHRDGTRNSAAGRFQRGQPSGSCSDTVAKSLSKMKNWLAQWGEVIARLSVIVFDPLLVYLVVVNEDKKCLTFVKYQGIMIGIVLRSVSDFLLLKYFTLQSMWIAFRENKRNFQNWTLFVICAFSNLPFTQVFMIILLAQRRVENNIGNLALKDLTILIIEQVLLRIQLVSKKPISRTWESKMFLPSFFCYSHVLGCIWYHAAVKAKLESWKKACKNHTGCVIHDLYCNDDSLENFIPNTTTSDFGIFKEFIQYDILEMTDFPRKLLFCLRWACQSICSFGQSLQINGEPRQDFLIIQVILFNLHLFVPIIESLQTNKQSDAVRVDKRKLNVQHIRNCMLIRKLSENLQGQVIEECERSVWIETRSVIGVDEVNLFNDHLPEDLKRMIKRELCLKLLKEVKEFERWGEALLDELCDFVKLVSYPKHTRIVREGGTIDAMLFLVEGKLQYHNFRNAKTGGSARRRTTTNYLRDGDFCGEELLTWFQADPYSSGLPISTKTIVALTNVVGFALMSDDLISILIKYHAALLIQSYWQKRQAARPIQSSLRRRRNTQTYIQEQTPPAESLEISIEMHKQLCFLCK